MAGYAWFQRFHVDHEVSLGLLSIATTTGTNSLNVPFGAHHHSAIESTAEHRPHPNYEVVRAILHHAGPIRIRWRGVCKTSDKSYCQMLSSRPKASD